MTSRNNTCTRGPLAIFLAGLLTAAAGPPAAAQGFQDYVAECGQKARDAGLTGGAPMKAFIKKCMAEKQGRDTGDSQGTQPGNNSG